MLTTTSLFNGSDQQKTAAFPSFQNDPFLTREFSKFQEENVGKVTPPTLRKLVGSSVSREGKEIKVPAIHEPRHKLDKLLNGAKSATNKASTRFEFTAHPGRQSDLKSVLPPNISQETPNFPKNYESFNSGMFGYDVNLPVELTEDAYHIRPSN